MEIHSVIKVSDHSVKTVMQREHKPAEREGTNHPNLPIHTTLLQNRRRNRPRNDNRRPLPHLRTSHPTIINRLLLPLPTEPPQRILREIETPPSLPTNTILIEIPPIRPCSNNIRTTKTTILHRLAQPPMGQLLSPLIRPPKQEQQHQQRNPSQRTNNPNNRILT